MILAVFEMLDGKKEMNEYYNFVKETMDIKNSVDKEGGELTNTSTDVIELMSINIKEVKTYYVLSKTMTALSFILSIVMCVLGFSAITSSVRVIFVSDISFMQAVIPVIGGVIVEAIAGTSLVVYKKSLEQLNQYYESLHNNEMFLSLVNLVDRLSEDKKDEAYMKIIENQLETLKK